MKPSFILTIDVEDWFQVENFSRYIQRSEWERFSSRVVQNTNRLLDLFEKSFKGIKATFFVLGWVAERHPDLIREIIRRGHEIASHGYEHAMCGSITSDALLADLIRSKKIIENITGVEVLGYRAPSFSISDGALQCIQQAGYRYDSSYNSFQRHGRYGTITTQGHPKRGIAVQIAPHFFELPISNLNLGGQTIPWGGGGYFRLLPLSIFIRGVRHILTMQKAYIYYIHPWEIDPEQPRVREAKGLAAFRHYLNLDIAYRRLSNLITTFRSCEFITCSQYLHKNSLL